MALAANISALTDELIEVVTNTFSEKALGHLFSDNTVGLC